MNREDKDFFELYKYISDNIRNSFLCITFAILSFGLIGIFYKKSLNKIIVITYGFLFILLGIYFQFDSLKNINEVKNPTIRLKRLWYVKALISFGFLLVFLNRIIYVSNNFQKIISDNHSFHTHSI